MDILNDYLRQLLSSCSDELRLEPDKIPYLVSEDRTTNVANTPLMGTQISTMIFPLIPPAVKTSLPHMSEVEFVHPHNLGNFNFTVQKSSSGFNVTVRPMIVDSGSSIQVPKPLPDGSFLTIRCIGRAGRPPPPVAETFSPAPETAAAYEFESSSISYDVTSVETMDVATVSDLMIEKDLAQEYVPAGGEPEVEVISFNDPAYQTVFSDTSNYEPPGRRDDFTFGEYVPEAEETFVQQEEQQPNVHVPVPVPVYSPYAEVSAPAPPAQAAFVPAAANAGMAAQMDVLFKKMAELGASDLHLSVSVPPMVRKDRRASKSSNQVLRY